MQHGSSPTSIDCEHVRMHVSYVCMRAGCCTNIQIRECMECEYLKLDFKTMTLLSSCNVHALLLVYTNTKTVKGAAKLISTLKPCQSNDLNCSNDERSTCLVCN